MKAFTVYVLIAATAVGIATQSAKRAAESLEASQADRYEQVCQAIPEACN